MRMHAIGSEHKDKLHDLVGGEIDLSEISAGCTADGRSATIKDYTGVGFIRVEWIGECQLGAGNYEISLDLTQRDIARLFVAAFGDASFAEAIQALAQSISPPTNSKRGAK